MVLLLYKTMSKFKSINSKGLKLSFLTVVSCNCLNCSGIENNKFWNKFSFNSKSSKLSLKFFNRISPSPILEHRNFKAFELKFFS